MAVAKYDDIQAATETDVTSVPAYEDIPADNPNEVLTDEAVQSVLNDVRDPNLDDDAFLNAQYFSKKLDMKFSTAYDIRAAIGSRLATGNINPTDKDIASIIRDMEIEEWRPPSLEPGPELGFWGRVWDNAKTKYFDQRNLEGEISRGPFLSFAIGEEPVEAAMDNNGVFREGFVEAVRSGFESTGADLVGGLLGRTQFVADATGNEKLQAWTEVMSSALDQHYIENPGMQMQLKPGTGAIGTMIQAIRRPEIIVQSATEMIPMVAMGYVGGAQSRAMGLGSKIGTIAGISESRWGPNYREARKQNDDVIEAFAQASLQSAGEGLLEEWALSAKVDLFKAGFGKWTQRSMSKKATDILLAGGKSGVRGFTEEGGQTVNSRFWELIFADDENFADALAEALGDPEVAESGGIGAVMETVLGGSFSVSGKFAKAVMMVPDKVKIAKLNSLTNAVTRNDTLTTEEQVEITSAIQQKKAEIQAGLDDTDTIIMGSVEEADELVAYLEEKAIAEDIDVSITQEGTKVTTRLISEPDAKVTVENGEVVPEEVQAAEAVEAPQEETAQEAVEGVQPVATEDFTMQETDSGGFTITDNENGTVREFESALILPEETQAKFKPEAKDKGIGLTKDEMALLPREIQEKMRFRQIQGEKVGFKIGEKQAKAEAADKLRVEKARLKKRYDASIQESRDRAKARVRKFYAEQNLSKANRKEVAGIIKEFFKSKEDLDIKARLLTSLAKAQNFTDIQKENFQEKILKAIDRAESRALTKELKKAFKEAKPGEMVSAFGKQAKKLKDLFTPKKEGEETIADRAELLELAKTALAEAKELNPDSVTVIEAESLVNSLEKKTGKVPLSELSIEDKRELIDLLRGISAMSRQERAVTGQRDKAKISDRKKAILSELKPKPKGGTVRAAGGSIARGHGNLESISDNIFGGRSGSYDGWIEPKASLTKYVYDVVNDGYDAQLRQLETSNDLVRSLIQKHGIDPVAMIKETHKIEMLDVHGKPMTQEFTTAELLSLYMHTRSAHNLEALVNEGMDFEDGIKRTLKKIRGFTREKVDEMVGLLTTEQKAFAKDVGANLMDGVNRKGMNTTSLKMEGIEIATEPNYWPAERRVIRDMKGAQITGSELLLESMGFLQARSGTGNPLRLKGFFHTVYDSNKNVAAYAGMAPALRDAKSVLTKDVKGKFEDAGWNKEFAAIEAFIKNIEGTARQLNDMERTVSGVFAHLRVQFAESVFALNPKIWARQQLSSLLVKAYVEGKYLTAMKGVADAATIARIYDISPQTKDRIERHRYDKDIGDANLNAEFHNFLLGDSTMESLVKSLTSKDIKGAVSAAKVATLSGMKYFDTNAIVDVFRVAEAEVQDKRPDLKEGSKQYNDALKARFEWLVRHTQPMWHAKDRSLIGSSQNELIRQFTMFTSQREQIVRMVTNATVAYNSGTISQREFVTVLSVVAANIVLFTAYGLAWAAGVEGREKDAKDAASELARNAFGNLFFSRVATEVVRAVDAIEDGRFVNVDVDSGPISLIEPGLEGSAYLYSGIKGAITGKRGWQEQVSDGVKSLAETGLQLHGLPYTGPKNVTRRLRETDKKRKKSSTRIPL